jgi:hypothetical protein
MRLKARLRRLERDVEWLRFWGALRVIEMKLELIEKQKALEAHRERRAQAERRPPPCPRPSPRPKAEAPPPPPVASPPEAVALAAPVADPPPMPPALLETHEIPEHMQIRPVRWALPGERWADVEPHKPEDDAYDPFAEFRDD